MLLRELQTGAGNHRRNMAPQQTWLMDFYEAASSKVDLQRHLESPGGLFLHRGVCLVGKCGCQIRVVFFFFQIFLCEKGETKTRLTFVELFFPAGVLKGQSKS